MAGSAGEVLTRPPGSPLTHARKSFRFRVEPTNRQVTALEAMLKDHCLLYNAALQERRDAWRHSSKTSIRYSQQSAQLTAVREFDPDLSRWSFSSQQATLRRLDKAFVSFFDRVKKGLTPGYPRFRSVRRFDSVTFPRDGDGCRWDKPGKNTTSNWTQLYLQGVGHLKVNTHRAVAGVVKTITVKREGPPSRRRWFVVLSCDQVPVQSLPVTGREVGIDLATGDNGLAWTSHGERIDNPQPGRRGKNRLGAAHRMMTENRPRPGRPANLAYRRACDEAAIEAGRQARIRLDHHHKAAARLIAENDLIVFEGLSPGAMTKRCSPKPDPDNPGSYLPNGQAAKSGLNRSILDSGWSQFTSILTVKAEWAGRTVVKVNPAFTSQTCLPCGKVDANSRSGKRFTCTECGWEEDADINAAGIVLTRGKQVIVETPGSSGPGGSENEASA